MNADGAQLPGRYRMRRLLNSRRSVGQLLAVILMWLVWANNVWLFAYSRPLTTATRRVASSSGHATKTPRPDSDTRAVSPPAELVRKPSAETYAQLPVSFEANEGQMDARVRFMSRGSGYNLFLTPTETVFVLNKRGSSRVPS